MNLYDKLLAPHLGLTAIAESEKGSQPSVTPLSWEHRSFTFVFDSKLDKFIKYNIVILDRIAVEARILMVSRAPRHALCSELFPIDLMMGFRVQWNGKPG